MKTGLLLFFFLSIFIASAQEVKIKFGKVSPEDLAMKVYEADTEAVAVILSKISNIRYDFSAQKLLDQRHYVIKILNDAGINEYGNAIINYYSYNNYERVGDVKALVHLPDGSQIKVENSQIFEVRESEYWSSKKVAFPKLVPGAIIEYQFVLQSENLFHPVDWYFQERIPIRYTELTTKIPDWYDYVILTQGEALDYKNSEIIMENDNGFSVKYQKHTFINNDVPALKEECCITTMDDYFSRIRYQLSATQFPGKFREPVMESWEAVSKRLYDIPEWGGQFRNKGPGENVLSFAGISMEIENNPMEIAEKLYSYLNDHVQWNKSYGISLSNTVNDILKAKSGNSGDLNKLMLSGLIQAGIDAKPALLSTRNHGKPLELYPFTEQFNHMVILARIHDKELWIDLGDKYRPLGTLRPNAINSRAWVVDKTTPVWIDIKPQDGKSVYLIKALLDQEGNISGSLESRFTGYHATEKRVWSDHLENNSNEELIKCGENSLKLSDIEFINNQDVAQPLLMKGKIDNQNVAMATPDKLYLNPIFPAGFDELPFKLVKRTYPIEMVYPEEYAIILDIALPEGYVIESLPEPVKFVTENNGIQITYNATQLGEKLTVTMKHMIKQLIFDPSEYETLKGIYNERRQKFNELIVLSKA